MEFGSNTSKQMTQTLGGFRSNNNPAAGILREKQRRKQRATERRQEMTKPLNAHHDPRPLHSEFVGLKKFIGHRSESWSDFRREQYRRQQQNEEAPTHVRQQQPRRRAPPERREVERREAEKMVEDIEEQVSKELQRGGIGATVPAW